MTRFNLYTNTDYQLWYTIRVYSAADVAVVMMAAVEVENAMEHDHHIAFFLTVKADVLVSGMLYRGGAPSKTVFQAFDDIKPVSVVLPETVGTQLSLARALSMEGGTR